MFDIGWTELLIIGIVALIVVGPKDLPGMFRTLGRFMGKARAMAREFQRAMEQAADDSGVKDMAREFRDAASSRDFGSDDLKDMARNPKAWAGKAARKSVLKTDRADKDAPDDDREGPETAAPGRGPATEALAEARSRAAQERRARHAPEGGQAADDDAATAPGAAAPRTDPPRPDQPRETS